MTSRSALSIAALAVALPLLLAGCLTPANPTDTPSDPIASPTATATPEPTQSGPTALPADCAALVATADPAQFGSTPLNSPTFVPQGPSGVVTPTTPPAGADALQTMRAIHELWCLWADPSTDITHLSVEVGHLAETDADPIITALIDTGYDCAAANGGQLCSITVPNSQFPVDDNYTFLFRDDVAILVDQTNFPTNNLMVSLVEVIWG